MNLRFIRNIVLVLALAVLCGGIGYRLGASQLKYSWNPGQIPALSVASKLPPSNKQVNFSLFWQVWDEVSQKFVDKSKLDSQKMVYGAISGMVESLDDPYTVFLPPKENKESKEQLNGNFEGIGAQLGVKDKRIIVVAPIPDSPAQRAGIRNGDWIMKIDGNETLNLTLPEAVAKIRGPKGTTVVLTILHQEDEKPVDLKIVRDAIVLLSVEWKEVKSTASASVNLPAGKAGTSAGKSASLKPVAYVKLARFGDNTDPQWNKVIEEVAAYVRSNKNKTAGVVLDVRNNPGGYLNGSVYTAAEFLPLRTVVVKQQNYDGSVQTYSIDHQGRLLSVPLVVLINEGTASASEILAGALQVAGRAAVVGHQSYGKGSVQQTEDLPGGAGLHITSAKWLLSSDVWIQGKGLTPDFKVENDQNDPTADAQLEKAIAVLNGKK